MQLEHLKGLLFWDRVMIFDATTPEVKAFLTSLRVSLPPLLSVKHVRWLFSM
jgi:hypothetical protein